MARPLSSPAPGLWERGKNVAILRLEGEARGGAAPRGLHSSTFQLNLSRF